MTLDTIQSGAAYIKVGTSTLRRWVAEGRLPVVRLGRRVLIRREILDALIKEAESPVTSPTNRRKIFDAKPQSPRSAEVNKKIKVAKKL